MRGLNRQQLRDLFRFAITRLREDRLPQVAGSLTFTTILSLVPMITIALALFTAFPLFSTFRASLEAYFVDNLMPRGVANTILGYLNQFASKSARLSAVGAAALIVTSVLTMSTIESVFNQIWRVKKARPLLQRVLVYWAIITLGPLLMGISISVTSYLSTATGGAVRSLPLMGAGFYTLVSVLISTAAYTFLYSSVPNQTVDWRDAAAGGLLAAVGVEISKRLFAIYILKFPTYTMVYGAVAVLPIFLVWIYMMWMITLMGALLTAALPVVRYERWWHTSSPGAEFVDAIAVLRFLNQAREGVDTAVVDMDTMRRETRLGLGELNDLLRRMAEAGWVASIRPETSRRTGWNKRVTDGMDRWALVINPANLHLADVYRLFVFDSASLAGSGEEPLVQRVGQAVDVALEQSLQDYCVAADAGAELVSVVAAIPYEPVPLAQRRKLWERSE
ncbi:YihY family inner membrane protein [Herbaspirillum sp. alder98]|uniref:YihY family inner membrane protein n=1 Tax=Herbaspirillum sp. alder98 TaxID=2913096 RepID=UPI001CD8B2E7|nr:YihY family inner membrane protein [Herbaspirillum sp. alder98]MCA1323126.1 YihY family inner membrane protein [Herbaspirillum sp. alder98]